jgi:hypothetical protein
VVFGKRLHLLKQEFVSVEAEWPRSGEGGQIERSTVEFKLVNPTASTSLIPAFK